MSSIWRLIELDEEKKKQMVELSKKLGTDPYIIKLMMNRGYEDEKSMRQFLNPAVSDIHRFDLMLDMEEAVEIIAFAVESGSHIRVFGDYDIDGVMSTYILHQALLKAAEATESDSIVDYQLPHRIKDGYGLNTDMVEKAREDGVELIITCDNGISAGDAIRLAKEYGIQVVVTDHHEIPFEMDADGNKHEILPPADAVVDPHRADDTYPFSGICGGVVAWKVMMGLFEFFEIPQSEAMEYIEYAAFATIGDIMELRDENRAIVSMGLKRLQNPKNIGLRALIKATELSGKTITAFHIGFILGPCVNATGRLDTAERGVELLETETEEEAHRLANELVSLNQERKQRTENGTTMAKELAEGKFADDKVMVIYLSDIHESIAGIIAGRVREATGKPTFIITDAEGGGVKGSGRSIENYNMFEKMTEVADVFTKFGGHPMAAGFSLESKERVDEMRERLNELCGLSEDDLCDVIPVDIDMPFWYMNKDRVYMLDVMEPFGQGNPKPKFTTKVRIQSYKRFGKVSPSPHMLLRVADINKPEYSINVKLFNRADEIEEYLLNNKTAEILYYPVINEFNGQINTELNLMDWRKYE